MELEVDGEEFPEMAKAAEMAEHGPLIFGTLMMLVEQGRLEMSEEDAMHTILKYFELDLDKLRAEKTELLTALAGRFGLN